MTGLIDTITGALSGSLVDRIGSGLGESPGATDTALKGLIPVVLGAMANKAENGGGLADLVKGALAGGNPLDNPDRLAEPGAGSSLVSSLFGTSLGPVVAALASRFGLGQDAITKLLGVAGLLGAGGIGRLLGNDPTPDGIAGLLRDERPSIVGALPAGVGGLLGLSGAGAAASASAAPAYTETVTSGSGLGKWLPWLLLALVAIALFFGLRSCGRDNDAGQAPTDYATTEAAGDVAPAPASTPAPIPTGAGLTVETRNGLPALNVYFDVGKSDVTNDLAAAAAPIKAHLDSHSTATLSVSGFNDPTGNAAANAELSKRRAQQVAAALTAAGIPEASIKLEKPAETTGTAVTNAGSRRVEVTINP